jgi:hypothetical protein
VSHLEELRVICFEVCDDWMSNAISLPEANSAAAERTQIAAAMVRSWWLIALPGAAGILFGLAAIFFSPTHDSLIGSAVFGLLERQRLALALCRV